MKNVVVTGIGAVSPLGSSFRSSWKAAKSGITGIDAITRFDASMMKWNVSGEIKGFDPAAYLSKKEILYLDPFVQYAVAAAVMAAEDAGLKPDTGEPKRGSAEVNPPDTGVIIGSSRGGISSIENALLKKNAPGSRLSPHIMPSTTVNAAASYVARKLGLRGHCLGISNACASGTSAIGEAYRLIRAGYAARVFTGGTEAPICRLCIEGYGMAGALSKINNPTASRPFDKTRDGFVLSEGACILVLEDEDAAKKRGAGIYGRIAGYGNTTDAFHMTRPAADGEAMAIRAALDEAGIMPDDIDYISAHGTSTMIGDLTEASAIKQVFGKKAKDIPVSAMKSMTGHMLAASGAFETAAALMSLKEGVITPSVNLKNKDHEFDLNIVTEATKVTIKNAVSNSFGFGGVNSVLVISGL